MKTSMQIKTDGKSLFNEGKEQNGNRKIKHQNRPMVSMRALTCAALIAILAACGYAGTNTRGESRMAAAPVVSREIVRTDDSSMTFEAAQAKYAAERAQEIAILDGVLADTQTDAKTRQIAQQQKLQLAQRMETEAGVEAALLHMGCQQAAAICADGRLVLLLAQEYADEQEEVTRIVDAASAVSGYEAKDVKLILVKK